MGEDLLRELLTSPLEETRRSPASSRARGSGITGLWVILAMIIGAVIVGAAYLVADTDPTPDSSTTTTQATIEDGSPQGLPQDYTRVGDRLGMRVERILERSDGVFVTLTTVLENSLDPDQSAGFQGGLWSIVLADGSRVSSTNESFDPLARGTVTVFFPPGGYDAQDITDIEISGVASRMTNVVTVEGPTVALDASGSTTQVPLSPSEIDLDVGVVLALETLELGVEGGELRWALEGESLTGASVSPLLNLERTDGTTNAMTTRQQVSGFNFFHPSIPSSTLADSGVLTFVPPSPEPLDAQPALRPVLELQVTWAFYSATAATIPIGDAVIAELND